METVDPKYLDRINRAFARLSENGPYECRPTNIFFGKKEILKPFFIECFTRYDKTLTKEHPFTWLPEYDKVIEWMAENKGKGLFMFGSCGRGKSKIIKGVLIPAFISIGKYLPGFHASLLPVKSAIYDNWNYEQYRKWKVSYIDELGTECAVNNYGERFEPFNEIINVAEEDLNILIISSNMTPEQFLQRYGNRSMDRINRLCKNVEFTGESLRP